MSGAAGDGDVTMECASAQASASSAATPPVPPSLDSAGNPPEALGPAPVEVPTAIASREEAMEVDAVGDINAAGSDAGAAAGGGSVAMDVEAPQAATQPPEAPTPADDAVATPKPPELGDTEEDDPVVKECDVYLNRMYDPPDFVGDMYVLQYPLRPRYRPYGDHGELDKVELKEKARRLRFVYQLHKSNNYDDDGVVNGKLQKHVLNSVVVANPACSYAVGIIHKGRMVVTPLRAVNQLRPDFEHFDKQRAKQSKGVAPGADGGNDSAGSGAENDAPVSDAVVAQPVRVEYVAPARASPVADVDADVEAEEPWNRLAYYNWNTEEATDILKKRFLWPAVASAGAAAENFEPDHPKLQKLSLDPDKGTYLATTCGQIVPKREAKKKVEDEADGLSAHILSRMPPERQIAAVVRHLGVASYQKQLKPKLPAKTVSMGDAELLKYLRQSAVLVSGNWVIKSDESLDGYARDLLLCLFHQKQGELPIAQIGSWSGVFTKSKMVDQRMLDEIKLGVSRPVTLQNGLQVWRMKRGPDVDFMSKFPEVAQEFSRFWEQRRKEIQKELASSGSALMQQTKDARIRSKLIPEVHAALVGGAMSLPDLRRHIQKRNTTEAIREEDLQRTLQDEKSGTVQVRNLWALAKSGNKERDDFRSAVFAVFRARDTATKEDILAEYQQLHGEECKLDSFVLRMLIREIAEKVGGDQWVLKGLMT